MNREKQIEEMAEFMTEGVRPWAEDAEALYNAGYRKTSDIAREIFEEIEKKVKRSIAIYVEEMNKEHIKDTTIYDRFSGSAFAFQNMADFIAELKKKYTEDK